MKIFLFILSVTFFVNGFSQKDKSLQKKALTQTYPINNELQYVYPRPKFFNFITGIPNNYANLGKETVKKNNLKWLGLTAITTGLFFAGDEILLDESNRIRDIGVTKKHRYKILGDMVDVPTNTSAAMYH